MYLRKFQATTNLINIPHVFHVETTWKQPFPRCFNEKYKWCVSRKNIDTNDKNDSYVIALQTKEYLWLLANNISI